MRRFAIAILLLAVPAAARPPRVDADVTFVRIDEFGKLIAGKHQQLKYEEEFRKKPFPEQLVIKWGEGATEFKTMRKIDGPDVIETVFEWEELRQEKPSEAALRVCKELPEVLKKKYGAVLKMDNKFKRERYRMGRLLVDELVKPPLHVRQLAADCLEAMHHTRQNYVADDDKEKRARAQKRWKTYIDRVRN